MKTPALAFALALAAIAMGAPAGAAGDRPAGIQWYGTWVAAKAEARRTDRPILLVAAAPHCHHVSGVW